MSDSTRKNDSGRDYRRTDTTSLTHSPFPVQMPVEFRVYFEETAHAAMNTHAHTATHVELGGVLVGEARTDAMGPYVFVAGSVPAQGAKNNGAQITFTHEAWAYINEQCDAQYPNYSIVGWYHTHPGFGIFLSDMDRFIHDSFFDQPFHIAVVIDPVANQEGCFVWREGEPSPITRYWSGDQEIRLAGAKNAADNEDARKPPIQTGNVNALSSYSARRWVISGLVAAAIVVVLLGLGYRILSLQHRELQTLSNALQRYVNAMITYQADMEEALHGINAAIADSTETSMKGDERLTGMLRAQEERSAVQMSDVMAQLKAVQSELVETREALDRERERSWTHNRAIEQVDARLNFIEGLLGSQFMDTVQTADPAKPSAGGTPTVTQPREQ